MPSASRGLAPREGLECWLMKTGRTGQLVEPRRGPQAGKSGDPRSQNADTWFLYMDPISDFMASNHLSESVLIVSSL